MLDNNYRMISSRYSRDAYLRIHLSLDSSQSDWDFAVGIFEDRFVGRYFRVIDLLEEDIYENGFAIMTLNCSLIDALMQFRNGYPETPEGKNGYEYKNFLREQLGFKGASIKRFYEEIRCGLLHSAETKNGSYFKYRTNRMIGYGENEVLFVDINLVTDRIRNYFNRYCEELIGKVFEHNIDNSILRANFIKKMDDITLKYEGYEFLDDIWFAVCSYNEEDFRITRNNTYKLYVPENVRGCLFFERYGERIIIKKQDIERAIPFWPSKKSICTLKNGEFIYVLLQKCKKLLKSIEEKSA